MILKILLYGVITQFFLSNKEGPQILINSTVCEIDFVENLSKSNKQFNFITTYTTKTTDTTRIPEAYYVIAGSFLIPKNAEDQVLKLKKLGFTKSYKYIFPESGFYSVVVDTFKLLNESYDLTERLKKNKVDYFIKNF